MTKKEYLRQEGGMALQHMNLKRRPDEHMLWHLRHKPYGGGTIENDEKSAEQLSEAAAGNPFAGI